MPSAHNDQRMYYPLTFRFPILSFTQEIYVTDAYSGAICFAREHVFQLREKVEVFADDTERSLLASIEADRVIDWSARYTFRAPDGRELGSVGRRGMKSLWRAHYDVFAPGARTPTFVIQETNPFVKLLNDLVGEIPVLGLVTDFVLHPGYLATRVDGGAPVMKLTKRPSFDECRFVLAEKGPATEGEQLALLLSFLMMNLLERDRG
ncbi:hypothetical protein [Prosthecobacter sp.]|uniref:hypothetical protein n=1 Tax=Prosthecobacter sp. TaxID=1965333 RepID=UPI003784BB30